MKKKESLRRRRTRRKKRKPLLLLLLLLLPLLEEAEALRRGQKGRLPSPLEAALLSLPMLSQR